MLERIFTGSIEHRRASFGRVVDENGETVDSCNVVFFAAPNSYTGEDVAEISVHGSYAVAVRLIKLITDTGLAVPAEPGEFTKRAFLNGKMDLSQAEAVMDIINSTAERQRMAAARQLEGRVSSVVASLYERIKAVCTVMAAAMDDESGEIVLDGSAAVNEIFGIEEDISELAEGGMRAKVLREGARIAIIGSPNVGKSSLLNALIKRERAIVTDIPGTTRDTVEEAASIEGIPVIFIDTAGIRESFDAVERIGIDRSKRELSEADLVLLLIDGSRRLIKDDERLIELTSNSKPGKTIAVITKSDLEQEVFKNEDGSFSGFPAACVSSITGDGLTALRSMIADLLAPSELEPAVTNIRHINALSEAAERLKAAASLIRDDCEDAAFLELSDAMGQLASVTGRDDPSEDLIDSVFSSFCVGK